MKKLILTGIWLLYGILLPAQELEQNVEERLQTFFREYTTHTANIGTCKLDSFRIDFRKKKLLVYTNECFAYQPLRPETVDAIYRHLGQILPGPVNYFDLTVFADGKERQPPTLPPRSANPSQQPKGGLMSKNIREININQIKIHDPFWSAMQHRMTDTVIPFQEKVLNDEVPGVEKSHAIENFRIAAGLSEGEFYGMVFQDSDVAKWLEGVAYSLAVKPDNELEARADEIIDIIEKAQQPDGYLDTFFIVKEPEHRWQNLQECHELYCAGHMMEAGVAYYQTTGKDKLLHVVERLADHIISMFGEDKEPGIPGHQEVEIGLMKLYRATGKEKYKDMARYFLEERGKNPNYFYEEKKKRGWQHWGQYSLEPLDQRYTQTHATIYEQKEAVGHSVRAVYMYTAMADLADRKSVV